MGQSKVEIANIALGMLGAQSIRDFNEDNKRARMCDAFFEFTRNTLISAFDWPFARRIAKLNQVVVDTPVPDGWYVYQLPADCATPRDVLPEGSREPWYIANRQLYSRQSTDVYLRYTRFELDTSVYSPSFCSVLALGLAIRLCMPLTQDKALARELKADYAYALNEVMEVEANIGTDYRESDNDPNLDTFVTSGGNGSGE